ncbi:unnamed protein product [Effrenium voratum]|nr:unnamed protein product [Effrenium voratum]
MARFTMSIQLERSFLGKLQASSQQDCGRRPIFTGPGQVGRKMSVPCAPRWRQEFCKEYKAGAKPCLAPSYRHIPRRGAHREMYS